MLAFERSRQQQLFLPYGDLDATLQELPSPFDMPAFAQPEPPAAFATQPFPYYENTALFAEAPTDFSKYDMMRSASSNSSLKPSSQQSELPPSAFSSASGRSLPSASSSTVGSPYSGHSHLALPQDSWMGSAETLDLAPTIVNPDSFAPEFVGATLEPDFSFGAHDKLPGSFVGECADLSLAQPRSSTFASVPTGPSAPSVSSSATATAVASPELLAVDSKPASTHRPQALDAARRQARPPQPQPGQLRARHTAPVFKSPAPPAPALFRTSTFASPAGRRSSVACPPSPTTGGPAAVVTHSHPPMEQHASQFQTHFFAQSSGSFVPPLESSCSSSPLRRFLLSCGPSPTTRRVPHPPQATAEGRC